MHIRKQRTSNLARFITAKPEISLERFEVRDLEVLLHEIVDVGFVCFRGGAVFGGESGAVGREGGGVPLRG